jgi:hypothetical protein
VLVAAFHTLTIVSARFHLPLEPLMAVWAAAGACRVANGDWRVPTAVTQEIPCFSKL